MMNTKRGFTLTEVLIVVVILGVLATLVLPRFFGQNERALVAEAVVHLSALRQAEEAYHLEYGTYIDGDDLSGLNIDDPNAVANRRFDYSADNNGNVTATRNGGDATFDGTTIILNKDGTWGGTHIHRPT